MAIQSWRSILRAFPGFIIVLCALSLNGPIQAESQVLPEDRRNLMPKGIVQLRRCQAGGHELPTNIVEVVVLQLASHEELRQCGPRPFAPGVGRELGGSHSRAGLGSKESKAMSAPTANTSMSRTYCARTRDS